MKLKNGQKIPDSKVFIFDNGPKETTIKELVLRYNIENKITFAGRIKREQVYEYLNKSDVFLNLYDRQNLTNTLWEAMLMGKCVITRGEYNNTREVIKHGQNGYLFSINEKDKIVDCLVKLYNDRSLLDKIGSKGKELKSQVLQCMTTILIEQEK